MGETAGRLACDSRAHLMQVKKPGGAPSRVTARQRPPMPQPTTESEAEMSVTSDDTTERLRRRRMEIFAFLFLTVALMPALAVATVGGYGLAVWGSQLMGVAPGPAPR